MSIPSTKTDVKKQWKFKFPHVYTFLFTIILLVGLMTHIVPAGEFIRVSFEGRTIIDPESFHYIDQHGVSLFDCIVAIPQGFVNSAAIIGACFFYMAGIGMYMETEVFHKIIYKMLKKFGGKGEKLVVLALMMFMAFQGGLLGNITPQIAFVPLTISFALMIGANVTAGLLMVLIPTFVAFATAPLNPYTTLVAQTIAELPAFSGLGMRVTIFVLFTSLGFAFVFRYISKVKKTPELRTTEHTTFVSANDADDKKIKAFEEIPFSIREILTIVVFVANIAWAVVGPLKLGYGVNQLSAVFLASGILAGIVYGYSADEICEIFIRYGKTLFFGAMCIGTARAVVIVLGMGGITDTVVYNSAKVLEAFPPSIAAIGIFIFQALFNFLVGSGSGQAAITMPVLYPIAEILGITRQTSVLAFQLGDGLTNMFWPTGGVFMYLGIANLDYTKYIKTVLPFFILLIVLAGGFVFVASVMNYGPF